MKHLEILNSIELDIEYQGITENFLWNDQKTHTYKCVMKKDKKQYTFNFHQGLGIDEEPTITSIMYTFIMDYYCNDYTFNEFCNEFGYDEFEDNKAKLIFKLVQKQNNFVSKAFNDEEIETLQEFYQDY